VVTAALVPASAEQHHHWSYSGEGGPSHWAELDAKNAACGEGKSQSPVNIRTQDVRRTQLPKLMFNYQPAPLHIIDNGHSVQINVEPGSVLKVGDKSYQLLQFHFHHPSEELMNGQRSEMVAHLVHRDTEGKLAVVAALFRTGQPNATVGLFKIDPDGREAHRVQVKFGRTAVNTIEILEGLQVGDKVILSDMSPYDDPEVVTTIRKRHHAGVIVASKDPGRVEALLDDYTQRFYRDFFATAPPPDRPVE